MPKYIKEQTLIMKYEFALVYSPIITKNIFKNRYTTFYAPVEVHVIFFFLPVDLIEMDVATDSFDKQGLRGHNDNLMDVIEIINCVAAMYESSAKNHQNLINVPLCVDLVLNWMLSVYDV